MPEIIAGTVEELCDQLEVFERVLEESKVGTRETWVRFMRQKLRGDAKTWVESTLFREPGETFLRDARVKNKERHWDDLYDFIRK